MTKHTPEEWNKLVLEIWMLGFAVDRFTPYCAFCDYSGHVESLRIDIRASKENYTKEIVATEMKVDGKYIYGVEPTDYYEKKRDILKKILQDHEVDYSDFEKVATTVYDYAF